MHQILHTVYHTFPYLQLRRIFFNNKELSLNPFIQFLMFASAGDAVRKKLRAGHS